MEAEGTIVGQEGKRLLAVIRIKGRVNVKKEEERTLQLLRLTRKYSMALYPSDLPGLEGMLNKVRHLVTWGEIDQGT
ncbi:MAG: uL30 family ribosomal protein, partial [Fervidicoccaceae archaeon]